MTAMFYDMLHFDIGLLILWSNKKWRSTVRVKLDHWFNQQKDGPTCKTEDRLGLYDSFAPLSCS